MLVISRKINEAFHIEGDITVRIVDIRNGRVRIGIEAPESLRVWREEIPFEPRPQEEEKR